MALVIRHPVGLEYLEIATSILQSARLANPSGGLWEAADTQWWWRRDQHPDPARQAVWFEDDRPVAAAAVNDWGGNFESELFSVDHDISGIIDVVWPVLLEQIEPCLDKGVEIFVREDDPQLKALVLRAGFEPTHETTVTTWMRASERPRVSPLRDGFTLLSRDDDSSRPHHMVARNGERVAELLAECSLYRPELDLAIFSPEGELAGYALFWADPVTGVGLVEPMRTEDDFQNLGLGRHLLGAGLERLATQGCSRLKVSYIEGNEPARRLYLGAGFIPDSEDRTFRLQRP